VLMQPRCCSPTLGYLHVAARLWAGSADAGVLIADYWLRRKKLELEDPTPESGVYGGGTRRRSSRPRPAALRPGSVSWCPRCGRSTTTPGSRASAWRSGSMSC
jgi:hypothetical protein